MKKFWLVISLLLIFLGTSCSTNLDIEDGKIKDFVSVFNGDEAYDLVDYGRCYIENTHYKGNYESSNEIIGKHTSKAYFDKRNDEYYHYIETTASGNYVGEEARYNFNNQKTLCYASLDKVVYAVEVTDGVQEILDYDYDDIIKACQNFFYTEVSGGYHTGGVYYGDYILSSISKYYKHFHLDEEKNELSFEINISTPTEDGNEIVNCHNFVVNEYGLVLKVHTIAYYIVGEQIESTLVTTMECDYVTEFEKILKLEG